MKWRLISILLLLAFSGLKSGIRGVENEVKNLNLMPVPAEISTSYERFILDDTFKISVRGNPDPRLYSYTTNVLRRLAGRTGLFLTQDYITASSDTVDGDFIITVEQPGQNKLGVDESYILVVKNDKIELKSANDIGAMRGLETFLQLLIGEDGKYFFPGIKIIDHPRFQWRGLLVDVSRHFMPVNVIKRNLDAMAAVKMNVLHWHLVDDQGFRVECKTFPKLHEMGSDGYYYTQAQIKDVIAYADKRGIRILPEFDVPAHATSWLVGYPELASAPGPYTIERAWGIKNPTMDPTKESTYKFLDKFFAEMSKLFPDEYMHIGGDENNGTQWNNNPDIQAFMKKNDLPDNHALQTYFNHRILKILTKYNKKMIGWDEIFQKDLPKNVVIHSWRGHKSLFEAVRSGYMGILSRDYYIDLMKSAEFHYLNDPAPADSQLTTEEENRILGGEATSWAELVTPETIDSRIWPRTAAIAERLWSPRNVRNVEDMYRRLNIISLQLEGTGVTHIKNYDMMLRRLANNYSIESVRTLIDIVRQVEGYQRHFQGKKYMSYSPLTRAVDAARSESMVGREFNLTVQSFLQSKSEGEKNILRDRMIKWRDNYDLLIPIMEKSPILLEMEPMALALKELSAIGLDALNLYTTDQQPEKDWIEKYQTVLDNAKKPCGQTILMVTDGFEELLKNLDKTATQAQQAN